MNYYYIFPHVEHSAVKYNLPPTSDSYENRKLGIFPGRNAAGLPTSVSAIHPLNQFINPLQYQNNVTLANYSRNGSSLYGQGVGMMDWAYRGGVDQIRFDSLSYDKFALLVLSLQGRSQERIFFLFLFYFLFLPQ